nr:hypothetical protein BaRGS_021191 [Batillaria attramentaria]
MLIASTAGINNNDLLKDNFITELTLSTQNVTECIKSGASLDFQTTGGTMFLYNDGDSFVQTSSMNDQMAYAFNMDSWVRVDVPDNHVTMISFRLLDVEGHTASCTSDSVSLYLEGDSADDRVWEACREHRPAPDLACHKPVAVTG